jgi:hypothetical protein
MTIAKHCSGALIDGDFDGGVCRLGVAAMSPVTTVTFSDLFLSSVRFSLIKL